MNSYNETPLLSICIPIYNRKFYLDRMLKRFLLDKKLFERKFQLFISDNCSEENLQELCTKYQKKGLNLIFSRNDSNIGMDGNFEKCILSAEGKYLWILGSDDIPEVGIFQDIITFLENDIDVLQLINSEERTIISYKDPADFICNSSIRLTFISANIVSTKHIKNIDYSIYKGTFFTQVPAYLTAIVNGNRFVVLKKEYLQKGNDGVNNGGYNFFEVFCCKLLDIMMSFVDESRFTMLDFKKIKKRIYFDFILDYVIDLLILRKETKLCTENGWKHLLKTYKSEWYFYHGMIKSINLRIVNKLRTKLSDFHN